MLGAGPFCFSCEAAHLCFFIVVLFSMDDYRVNIRDHPFKYQILLWVFGVWGGGYWLTKTNVLSPHRQWDDRTSSYMSHRQRKPTCDVFWETQFWWQSNNHYVRLLRSKFHGCRQSGTMSKSCLNMGKSNAIFSPVWVDGIRLAANSLRTSCFRLVLAQITHGEHESNQWGRLPGQIDEVVSWREHSQTAAVTSQQSDLLPDRLFSGDPEVSSPPARLSWSGKYCSLMLSSTALGQATQISSVVVSATVASAVSAETEKKIAVQFQPRKAPNCKPKRTMLSQRLMADFKYPLLTSHN